MANLDSRSKRASSVGIMLPFVLALPLPDATLDQGDRQHVAWNYSGVLAVSSTFTPTLIGLADVYQIGPPSADVYGIPATLSDVCGIPLPASDVYGDN